jgi:hypothetical protein
MNNNICHIVGLDIFSKELIINNFKNSSLINILDLDILNESIFNENEQIIELDNKINNLEINKKDNKLSKNEKEKLSFYKKKLQKFWKQEFKIILENNLKNIRNKILFIGNSNLYNNIKIMYPIKSKLKYIVKINYDKYTQKIIKNNLENYNIDIIEGSFPLEYLSKTYLIKKRKQFESTYESKGYCLHTINQIIFTIKSNLTKHNNLNIPINLCYASTDICKSKIYPNKGNSLYAYSDEAIAIISILRSSLLVNNEIKIHQDDLEIVKNKVYLYKISGSNFIKYNGLDSKTYVTSLFGKINKTIIIYDILNFLKTKGYHYSYI